MGTEAEQRLAAVNRGAIAIVSALPYFSERVPTVFSKERVLCSLPIAKCHLPKGTSLRKPARRFSLEAERGHNYSGSQALMPFESISSEAGERQIAWPRRTPRGKIKTGCPGARTQRLNQAQGVL